MDSGIKGLQVYMVLRPGNMFLSWRGIGGQRERTSTGDKAEMLEFVGQN